MANVIARGYPYPAGAWEEGPPGQTFKVWSFRLWCRTDDGKTYSRYVDIRSELVDPPQPPGGGWPSDVMDTLYRSQREFERNPDTYGPPIVSPEKLQELEQESTSPAPSIVEGFKKRENKDWQDVANWASDFNLPSDPNNPNREHRSGPATCWCGRTHPPHVRWQADCRTAQTCWCREKHCGIGMYRP
jgi:hypothetical protein